jgi:hypothetical protein
VYASNWLTLEAVASTTGWSCRCVDDITADSTSVGDIRSDSCIWCLSDITTDRAVVGEITDSVADSDNSFTPEG